MGNGRRRRRAKNSNAETPGEVALAHAWLFGQLARPHVAVEDGEEGLFGRLGVGRPRAGALYHAFPAGDHGLTRAEPPEAGADGTPTTTAQVADPVAVSPSI